MAIRSTFPASEPVCSLCGGTGWRRAQGEDFIGFRRCECVRARLLADRLAVIPELFRGATFESFHARNGRQERALALVKDAPDGSSAGT